MKKRPIVTELWCIAVCVTWIADAAAADHVRELQERAINEREADWGHWGPDASKYSSWNQHTNRLIPVYTFGITLDEVEGAHSPYRSEEKIKELYGRLPEGTYNPEAEYFDQTAVYTLQKAAADAGKKYMVLFVFDGMDWPTTWAAATYENGAVKYREGRGTGLSFQDYRGAETDFGFCVTSPYSSELEADVNAQTIIPADVPRGGYDPQLGGATPWDAPADPRYITGQNRERPHAYTDSSSSATSLTCGIKTFNDAVNVDHEGREVVPIAHALQDRGWAIGLVTSVPISHATPACGYACNVSRDDFQDLTRDLVGLPSIAHRQKALPGVDVLLGAGWGHESEKAPKQGHNFIPGNVYIAQPDLEQIDVANGGRYRVVQRQSGQNGAKAVSEAAKQAATNGEQLFGMFGHSGGRGGSHLPFQTANGDYQTARGALQAAESYSSEDIEENPTLADLTRAALTVLETDPEGFWLLVEAGDVDWANHDNNIDNSIGAVKCGDAAFRVVTEWIEAHDAWDEAAVIVTADHGHYLVQDQPEALLAPANAAAAGGD